MARTIASWLSGPEPSSASGRYPQRSDPQGGYPGQRLGLPESGPRALARMGRRLSALTVDWLVAYGLAALAMTFGVVEPPLLSSAVLVIWFVLGAVAVRLFGFTPGQFALGLLVVSLDEQVGRLHVGQVGRLHVGLGRALVRGSMIALVIPALFVDSDGRGLQDRVTRTAVVRR